MTFVIGEVNAIPKREPGLIFEDDFNRGTAGWTQLMDVTAPTGPVLLDSEITYNNSRYSLLLSTEDQANSAGRTWGMGMALKRLGRPKGAQKVYLDYQWAWGSTWGENTPRAIEFGLDQADENGVRRFFMFRWKNYDETTSTRTHQWQVLHNGVYTDIAGATVDNGYNENKRNLNRLEMVFDLASGVYDGLRCNNIGFGSLASTPDNSLRAYAPAATTLVPFANGFNPMVSIRNRLNTNSTRCWVNLGYAKGLVL